MRLRYLPALALGFALNACIGSVEPDNRPRYRPLLMSRAQMESAVGGLPARGLKVPGKIFVTDGYLFVNELYQGVHIFDNADPAHPVAVQFVRIPGNVDLAVRGNLLYADNGPDLVTFDISNPARVRVAGRTRNALPELQPPVRLFAVPAEYEPANRPAATEVVGWVKQ